MLMETYSTESSSLLERVMQTLMEGVAITDKRGQLVFANQALEQLLGYEPGELLGRPWVALFPEKLHGRADAGQVRESGKTTSRYEARLLRKDGSMVPVLASSCPLSDGSRSQGVLSTFTDLREYHHLQAQVQQLAKPAFMGQHMASIIHEMSNSLTILFLQAQWLSRKGPMIPPMEEKLAVIRDQAKRMIQMVDDLRASSDPNRVNLETTDVNVLIERTLDLQKHQLAADHIEATTDLDPSLPQAGADPYKLQQVLVNLINNARQAIVGCDRPGKLMMTTRTIADNGVETPRIQVRVADNGSGIPPDVMPHIFEPFFTTKSGNSMGLGLSICEQIVKKHGGSIWAETNAGSGATFVLELPAASQTRREASTSPERPSAQQPGADRHHILVVDDEPFVAQTVGFLLQQEGFKVTTATGARQALTCLDQNHIDLIVTDLIMPRMAGPEFWQEVRRRYPRLARRIIFSTSNGGSQRWRAFLQDSGCAWIEKPFRAEELLRLVRETLPSGQGESASN